MANQLWKSGTSRDQSSLLPARVEDYVESDNPVRALDDHVDRLDLKGLGFRHGDRSIGVGQPPYDPGDLLKLYIYGYLNRVRSSRRLEREARRNLEVIWLLKGLRPGYRTIAAFRAENRAALKRANIELIRRACGLGLVGGTLVAIDGAFFHGDASKGSIKTKKKLADQIAAIERDLEAYGSALEANDAAEAERGTRGGDGDGGSGDTGQKIAALMAERTRAQADLDRLEESGETQVSRTDPDARLLTKSGQTVAGYNVQIAVDDKHKLIVASEVVNDGNDTGQLHPIASAAKEALGVDKLQVVADVGYYNGVALKACEDDAIVAYVPQAERTGRLQAQGRVTHASFVYDAPADAYRCPAGALLLPTLGRKKSPAGRVDIRYTSRKADCDACPLRGRCVTDKTPTRTIQRWEHEDVLVRHRARMNGADDLMRRRSGLVEHPFGTLKCRAGYRHFLVRGFDKVRGEWALMALCYNLARMFTILGVRGFIARLVACVPLGVRSLAAALSILTTDYAKIAPNPTMLPRTSLR
ncbi:MAG TPA: IS1182 family transposase [Polyangiaceae bacterium]|jgi:transposase